MWFKILESWVLIFFGGIAKNRFLLYCLFFNIEIVFVFGGFVREIFLGVGGKGKSYTKIL